MSSKQDIDVFNKFILEEEPNYYRYLTVVVVLPKNHFIELLVKTLSANFVGNYGLFLGEVEHTNPAKGEIYISIQLRQS